MIIQTHTTLRGIIAVSMFVMVMAVVHIINSRKDRDDYEQIIGKITSIDKHYKQFPLRDKEAYRYVKIDTYPYPFEIYLPNVKQTDYTIDNLQTGNSIRVYYYETENTRKVKINKFAQYIYKKSIPYYIRGTFQQKLGYIILLLSVLLMLFGFYLWKTGRLDW